MRSKQDSLANSIDSNNRWRDVQNELKIGDLESLKKGARVSAPCENNPVTPVQMENLKWLLAMICADLK